MIVVEIHSVLFEASVELWRHDALLEGASVGRVNKVTVPCHHEPDECDTHPVLVEEDVRMGTGEERG